MAELSKKELKAQKKAQFKEIEKLKYKEMTDEQKAIYREHEIRYWVTFVACLVVAYLFLTFVVQVHPVFVHGDSMNPTFHDRDLTLCVNAFYEPKDGDVVVAKCEALEENIIKRVIATEGQTIFIDYDTSTVYVDDKPLTEDYTLDKEIYYSTMFETQNPCTVPKDCVYLMGDNRNNSTDSRTTKVGLVNKKDIVGKVVFGGSR